MTIDLTTLDMTAINFTWLYHFTILHAKKEHVYSCSVLSQQLIKVHQLKTQKEKTLASSFKVKIMYTHTDEAPMLATYSLLPVLRAYCRFAGVKIMKKVWEQIRWITFGDLDNKLQKQTGFSSYRICLANIDMIYISHCVSLCTGIQLVLNPHDSVQVFDIGSRCCTRETRTYPCLHAF